jgi:hypothetical protein
MAVLAPDNGPAQKRAVKILSMEYDQAAAALIWQAWAIHMDPPAGHPLAVGTLAKDLVLAALTKPFPTATQAKAGAKALTDAIVDLISTQTFVDHTDQDLEEETEMEVNNTPLNTLPYSYKANHSNSPPTHNAGPSIRASSSGRDLAFRTQPASTRRVWEMFPKDRQPDHAVSIGRGHTHSPNWHSPSLLLIPGP